ncbi:hypothetical protein NEF87_002119 [Candidatus Lokiarchaeum ossiferum]|uniref:ABC3 transporter permease C-terminal domain-containing protein n=1 Tax=Candidatus Lokiarchaeum ossiferum TaxID=2951803 RepID=A0ABY6HQR0_9ARCH|nr:hypothetical protein NEF87_002119 [Candidatus Lokiarchaeum sp. B-35]
MKIMDIKVFREIKQQKFRSILIVSIVAVTLTMVLGMRAGYPMVIASYEENLRNSNVADGRFSLTAPVLEESVEKIQNDSEFLTNHKIADVEGRLITYTEIEYNGEIFPSILIGVEFPNQINQVSLQSVSSLGDTNPNFLANSSNCIIDAAFAGNLLGQDTQIGENVSLQLGAMEKNLTIQAIGQDLDFCYVVDPISQMSLMGQLAVIWIDLSEMQQFMFNGMPLINQVLFTVEDRLNEDKINIASDALLQNFASQGIDLSTLQYEKFDETIDRQFFNADAGSMDKMGTLFGIIGLIMCCVAIYNTISRLVQSQRKNIGLFMSLGANPNNIVLHYVKITFYLAVIGSLIGIPLGHLFAIGMTKLLARVWPFQVLLFPIVIEEYVFGALITLGVCIIFSGLSAFPITKITPREAMSAIFNRIKATKAAFSERLFSWLPGFRSIHMKVPIREIFLRKRKSAVTILAITTSMIMLITSIAMVGNMFGALNNSFEVYNTAKYRVLFESPVPATNISNFMQNLPADTIEHYESTITVYSNLNVDGNNEGGFIIECYQANSTFRDMNIISGEITDKKSLNSSTIFLGNTMAKDNEIVLGDEIKIGLIDNFTVKVVGMVGEFIDNSGYWTIESFNANNNSIHFGVPSNYVNGLLFNPGEDVDIVELRETIGSEFPIAQWVDAQQSQQSMMALIQSMMSLLILFVVVGMVIGVLFSFNTMYMGFISRENDFLAFKAMGTNPRYFSKMIFWENAILSVFSLIVTIPVGYFVYWQSMTYMMGDNYYIPLSIPWYTWPVVLGLSFISIGLATRKLTKRIRKMDLAEELRSRMVS